MFGNLTFAYTKPALCELYKKHPFCTKIHLFKTKSKKISGIVQPRWGGDTPPDLPMPHLLGASNSALPEFFF